jgi:hypothetical protein
MNTEKRELITYNKKFKPGTAGVKVTFSPDEMAFSREDMPLRAAMARREVLLSLQSDINGIPKRRWNSDVMVVTPHQPYNPQAIYVSRKNENDPDFRRDFYDSELPWDIQSTIDKKLMKKQFQERNQKARENSIKKSEEVANKPALVRRQIDYANLIKERGIPAAQPPPPFIVKKPKISPGTLKRMKRFETVKTFHDGAYQYNEALGGEAWSCCGNLERDSEGCRHQKVNKMYNLYD